MEEEITRIVKKTLDNHTFSKKAIIGSFGDNAEEKIIQCIAEKFVNKIFSSKDVKEHYCKRIGNQMTGVYSQKVIDEITFKLYQKISKKGIHLSFSNDKNDEDED